MAKRAKRVKKAKETLKPDYTDTLGRTTSVATRVMEEYSDCILRNQIHVPCKTVIEKIWCLLPKYNYDLNDNRLRVDLANRLRFHIETKKISEEEKYILRIVASELISQEQ